MPDPSLNVLERWLWYGDRLTEAGVSYSAQLDVQQIADLYRGTFRNGGELGSFEIETARDSWFPVNLGELPDVPPVQPSLGAIGIIYPGLRHVFSGPPESAKTIAAYVIGLLVVRTGEPVILLDFEMGAYAARSRLRELGAAETDFALMRYIEPAEPANAERINVLVALKPSLVIIDAAAGAYDLQGLDDNKRADVEKLARLYVAPFWQAGIATIFIDHVVKNSDTRGHYAIGSERKLGGADVHLGFETLSPISRGTSGRYKITTHKDRGGYLKRGHLLDLVLVSDVETHQISSEFVPVTIEAGSVSDVSYFRPTHLMEKCSAWLELQPEPVSRNAVFEGIGGRKAYVLKAISALVVEGFIVESDGPNRTRFVTSERPYREADEPVVPGGTAVVPEPLSDAVVPRFPPLTGGTAGPLATDQPKSVPAVPVQSSWLDDVSDAYLDSIAPEGDES